MVVMIDPDDKERHPTYLAYLLRLQLVDNAWRASLEEPKGRQRIHFASIEALFAFLQAQMEKTDHSK